MEARDVELKRECFTQPICQPMSRRVLSLSTSLTLLISVTIYNGWITDPIEIPQCWEIRYSIKYNLIESGI
jgi:hypothetical protein